MIAEPPKYFERTEHLEAENLGTPGVVRKASTRKAHTRKAAATTRKATTRKAKARKARAPKAGAPKAMKWTDDFKKHDLFQIVAANVRDGEKLRLHNRAFSRKVAGLSAK